MMMIECSPWFFSVLAFPLPRGPFGRHPVSPFSYKRPLALPVHVCGVSGEQSWLLGVDDSLGLFRYAAVCCVFFFLQGANSHYCSSIGFTSRLGGALYAIHRHAQESRAKKLTCYMHMFIPNVHISLCIP